MGRCLEVYSVDMKRLEAAIGSGDDALRQSICDRYSQDIRRANDWMSWSNEPGAPSIAEGIRELIMGDEQDIANKRVYYDAYKIIVSFFADCLANDKFCPHHGDYLNNVDKQLREHDAPIALFSLAYGGELPNLKMTRCYFDGVGYGYLSHETIVAAEEALASKGRHINPLDQVYSWLLYAKQRGHVLVGFFTI